MTGECIRPCGTGPGDILAAKEERVSFASEPQSTAHQARLGLPLQSGVRFFSRLVECVGGAGKVPARPGGGDARALRPAFLFGMRQGRRMCMSVREDAGRTRVSVWRAGCWTLFSRQVSCCRLNKKSRKGCADGVMPSGVMLQKKSVRRQWKDVLPEVSGERRFSD